MSDILLRVGAAADASLGTAFEPAEKGAKRASDTIAREGKKAGKGFAKGAAEGPDTLAAKLRELEARARKSSKGVETDFVKAVGGMAKEAKAKLGDVNQEFSKMAREAEREVKRMESAMARANLGLAKPLKPMKAPKPTGWGVEARALGNRAFARSLTSGGAALTSGVLGFGGRIANDMIRGAGVDTDLSSHVRKNVELETLTRNLSNSAYQPGIEGRNGVRQDPAELAAEIRKHATATGYGTTEAAEGLQEFVGKTGDLALGRDIFKDLAKLSRATGTNLNDMVSAAGEVSNSMGETPDKASKLLSVMQGVAGQGKLGAVEIKDMADKLGKLAASAPQFEGSFAKNMAVMGALAQESRSKGGSSSAAQSATSVMAFVSAIGKTARIKEFKKAGIDVMSKTDPGKFRDAQDIITESLQKTTSKGTPADPNQLFGKLFTDERSKSAVRGFANIYRDTYNDTKGSDDDRMKAATAAVTEEFERLKAAAMGEGETAKAFDVAMASTEVTAQVLNNKLQEQAQQLQNAVIPALVSLAPSLLELTQAAVGGIEQIMGITGEKKRMDENVKLAEGAHVIATAAAKQIGGYDAQGKATGTGSMTEEDSRALDEEKRRLERKLFESEAAAQIGREKIAAHPTLALGADGAEQKNRESDVTMMKAALAEITKQADMRDSKLMAGTLNMKGSVSISNWGDMPKLVPQASIDGSGRSAPKKK